MAWSACNNLHKIWTSKLHVSIKIQLFKTLIVPMLLYGCETWTLSKRMEKRFRWGLNLSWKHHPKKQVIYGDLPPVSSIVRSKRVQFAGHCFRATTEIICSLVLWKPKSVGRRSRYVEERH